MMGERAGVAGKHGGCDILILLEQPPAPHQHELHLHAMRVAQLAAKMQQQMLAAGQEGVMPHEQDRAALQPPLHAGDGPARGVEERRPIPQIGLEISAFRPFVPGVDAHDRLAMEPVGPCILDQVRQPPLVSRRRRPVQHQP